MQKSNKMIKRISKIPKSITKILKYKLINLKKNLNKFNLKIILIILILFIFCRNILFDNIISLEKVGDYREIRLISCTTLRECIVS